MYKIFFEPSVNEVTLGSIVRVDARDLDQVKELKNFYYDIVDSFENTYYLIPTSKKTSVKARSVLTYYTSGGDKRFDYFKNEWYKVKKKKETFLTITCHPSQLDTIIDLANNCGLNLMQCPSEDINDQGLIVYEDAFVQYESEAYKKFKNELKQL
ncbi:hypothetical protein JR311_19755 (plasmid) [Bacillus velezensis]|uniref:hypothetical protein n=1 Tax=Bacillus velezensis TaxID=492670 RepID=UPI00195DC41F|nr:hypothetical protein [Bacillus velezensis]QRV11418.1 hypothetical protein JR311_20570 [Bacillus velezensis]QRV11446.1 hypothetical protein JR311_19755 [Bacillus velezensis]